jgi:methylated-DNA-[protein]-cysteine S-methyltransferase
MPTIIVFPFKSYVQSPIGWIEIEATATHIHHIRFLKEDEQPRTSVHNKLTEKCALQLTEYFAGTRKTFDLPIQYTGTDFMIQVWDKIGSIPYGKTITYMDLAKQMGDESLTRAVGSATGKNNIAIVLPCHRLLGSNGKLTGFAWGLTLKQALLDLESKINNTYFKLF